jgi:hypothetical protein
MLIAAAKQQGNRKAINTYKLSLLLSSNRQSISAPLSGAIAD